MQQPVVLVEERRAAGVLGFVRGPARAMRRFARRQPIGFIASLVILLLVLLAFFGSLIAPYDPVEMGAGARLESPSADHFFGTDEKGRDVFSRIVEGARVSIYVGLISVAIGNGGGLVVGMVTGYFGGKLDMVVQRLMDAMMAFPMLVLAMAMTAVLGPGMVTAMIAIGVAILPSANRVMRGSTLAAKQNLYIEAARSMGASHGRIMLVHIFPQILAILMVSVSIMMGMAIVIEASLGFLGLGVQPPEVSWGRMLNDGRGMMEDAPWMILAPGVAIGLVVLAFNMLGDALRDYFDPSLRGR